MGSKREKTALGDAFKQQIALREFMFTLAHLYITTLLIEHSVHCTDDKANGSINNKIDYMVLKNWIKQTDLIPVVTSAKRGAYDIDQNELHGLVFEGYNSNAIVDGKFVR